MKTAKTFVPDKCECCGQTKEYVMAISKGTALLLKKFSRYVKAKGINVVHIEKEMVATGIITTNQYTNVKGLTAHGLLAKVPDEAGNYVLTRKGLEFLQGETVLKYAIMSKVEKKQIGYFDEDTTVNINDFNSGDDVWEGIGYDIKHGRVIQEPIPKQP